MFMAPGTAREILAHDYFHIFGASILFYDHLITLGCEIEYVWRRPKSISSYCFFFNRYCIFFSNVAVMALGFTTLPLRRSGFLGSEITPKLITALSIQLQYNTVRQVLLIQSQLDICFLLSLRVYALYGRSRRIRCLMGCTAACLFVVAIWLLFGQKSGPARGASGCHISVSNETAIRMSGAWWTLFVYDTLLFTLTVSKTWTTRKSHATGVPISQLLFRDGSLYFAIIALANFANILTYYFCRTYMKGGLSTFAADISGTMMSRLMLNLHEATYTGIHASKEMTRIELDTLWSGALDQSSIASMASHNSRATVDEEMQGK